MDTNESIINELRHVFVEELDLPLTKEHIVSKTPIFAPEGIVFESMALLELLLAVEDHFDVEIEDHILETGVLETVSSFATYLSQLKSRDA